MKKAGIVIILAMVLVCFGIYFSGLSIKDVASEFFLHKQGLHNDAIVALPKSTEADALISANQDQQEGTSEWVLVWEDDFDKNLNLESWNKVDRGENYNNELQYYCQLNSYTESGSLFLVAKKEEMNGKKYTSAMIDTQGKLGFQYGKIDVRMKFPHGDGFWPAVWLLPEDESNGYWEIDLMEMIGNEPSKIYAGNYYENDKELSKNYGETSIANPDAFHTYSLEWNETSLIWFVDGKQFHISYSGVPKEKMYIMLNLAIGGDWAGEPTADTPFPSTLVIDYIKYYKHV